MIAISLIGNDVIAESKIKFFLEAETFVNYRDSDSNRFATNFPFPPEALPVGQTNAFIETVDAGQHLEVSSISFKGGWQFNHDWSLLFKLDTIDLYDRNPTSEDRKVDLDNLLLRFGKKTTTRRFAKGAGGYIQLGKFEKFERQNDRHLQSYGLASTSFNRFEDTGIEFGYDVNAHFYLKGSITTGNPVFMRDPNALAGDNGTSDFRPPFNNPEPDLKSGIVILYDAEIEDFNLQSKPELGLALGYRSQGKNNQWQSELMLWGYQRDLAESRDLHGTFYGGDLDLLDGVADFSLPIQSDRKKDIGFNYWFYNQELTAFIQMAQQYIAGLERTAIEVELSYRIAIPFDWFINGKPVIKSIAPAVRYSVLDTDFSAPFEYPAPSVAWDWEKLDIGLRLEFQHSINLTIEFTVTEFETKIGTADNNELLVTLGWRKRF